ncbi:unnamed protein product [Auanema sp. JU1783]|nr:unnamed protein product [Auanema sp. JU1783]
MDEDVSVDWILKKKDFVLQPSVEFQSVLNHPLQPKSAYYKSEETKSKKNEEVVEFIDPLGVTVEDEVSSGPSGSMVDMDVLMSKVSVKRNSFVLDNTLESKPTDRVIIDINLPDFEPWRTKRAEILANFSTNEKLTITSSFLSNSKSRAPISDKRRRRMEMLEDMSGLKKISELSQAEFVSHVNELRELLIFAWDNNKRVEAIRIVTEVARMLSSQVNSQFYPNQWVLVTDILDLFGKLVYHRILSKANEERNAMGKPLLVDQFDSADIPEKATDMVKNWFCKIADIKEIIPRFYVETSLICSLKFLDSSDRCHENMMRLCAMTGKFPQPLLGAYARAYVCKIAMSFNSSDRSIHWRALNDSMQQTTIYSPELTSPAYEWIIQCVSYNATSIDDLGPLWEYAKMDDKRFLVSIFIKSAPARYVSSLATAFCELVLYKSPSVIDIVNFGERLLLNDTPELFRNDVLLRITKVLLKFPSCADYVYGYATWSKYVGRYFDFADLCDVAYGLSLRLQRERRFSDKTLKLIVEIIKNLVTSKKFSYELLKNEAFQTVLDYVRDEPHASNCAKTILTEFIRSNNQSSLKDFSTADFVLEECRILCDSISPDTDDDEIRYLTNLICSTLDRVCYTEEVEKGMALLIRARAQLGEIPEVIKHVVFLMIDFTMYVEVISPDHKRKANFSRSCLANLFITIASIEEKEVRVTALIRTIYISLLANSLPQCYSVCNAVLSTMSGLAMTSHLLEQMKHFLCVLVSVGGPLDLSPMHYYDSLVEIIEKKALKDVSLKFDAWLSCLSYLLNCLNPSPESKIVGVDANDTLYGLSDQYLSLVNERVSQAMNSLISILDKEDEKKPQFSISLVEFVVDNFELNNKVVKMVLNLLKRVMKSGTYERRKCVLRSIHGATFPYLSPCPFPYTQHPLSVMSLSDLSFDDDFEMDYVSASPATSGMNKPSTNMQAFTFEDGSEQYQRLQEEMNEVDELAGQLKFALELRVKMEGCSSSRMNDDAVISSHYQVQCLSSESFIFVLHLKNNSIKALSDWFLIVTFECLDKKGVALSHTLELSYLEPNQTRCFELFLEKKSVEMPILVRSKLIRKFNLFNSSRILRISLDREVITHLNFLKYVSDDNIDKKNSFGSFSHIIPTSLLNLLSGCPDVVQPVHFLNFVFGVGTPWSNLNADQSVANGSIDLFQTSHPIRIETRLCDETYNET